MEFLIKKTCTKRVAVNYFQNWKFSLLELVDNKISKYSTKIKSRAVKSAFQDPDAKAELNRLRNHFFVVPIDKAANNVAFICKHHYPHVLVSELKYNSGNHVQSEDDTYELIKISSSEIVNSHNVTLSEYDLPGKEDMNCLPSIY